MTLQRKHRILNSLRTRQYCIIEQSVCLYNDRQLDCIRTVIELPTARTEIDIAERCSKKLQIGIKSMSRV